MQDKNPHKKASWTVTLPEATEGQDCLEDASKKRGGTLIMETKLIVQGVEDAGVPAPLRGPQVSTYHVKAGRDA